MGRFVPIDPLDHEVEVEHAVRSVQRELLEEQTEPTVAGEMAVVAEVVEATVVVGVVAVEVVAVVAAVEIEVDTTRMADVAAQAARLVVEEVVVELTAVTASGNEQRDLLILTLPVCMAARASGSANRAASQRESLCSRAVILFGLAMRPAVPAAPAVSAVPTATSVRVELEVSAVLAVLAAPAVSAVPTVISVQAALVVPVDKVVPVVAALP